MYAIRSYYVIIPLIIDKIRQNRQKLAISIAGESGCGKSETAKAFVAELKKQNFQAKVLGLDNYFNLPPIANDIKRKADYSWLGPRKEVNMERIQADLKEFLAGSKQIVIPNIPYYSEVIDEQLLDIEDTAVLIVEGTYTSLLRNVGLRVFIDADYRDTRKFRELRSRGDEVNDPLEPDRSRKKS